MTHSSGRKIFLTHGTPSVSGAGSHRHSSRVRTSLALFWPLLLILVLPGCNTSAIFNDHLYNPPVHWGTHVVKKGETLYRIAWRYGRDYRELGRANGLSPPWTIKPGQVIRLDRRGSVPTQTRTASRSQSSDSVSRSRSTQPSRARSSSRSSQGSQTVANVNWHWPHGGTVIAGYSTSGKVNKGIDIAGSPGDAVKAAADGSVVYAGNGLLGYGNLIIVNHNEHYLSAYAHNRKILVQEGEDVKAGQVIAELGSTGTDRPVLHFEIRKNGNPVDPSRYLPGR